MADGCAVREGCRWRWADRAPLCGVFCAAQALQQGVPLGAFLDRVRAPEPRHVACMRVYVCACVYRRCVQYSPRASASSSRPVERRICPRPPAGCICVGTAPGPACVQQAQRYLLSVHLLGSGCLDC